MRQRPRDAFTRHSPLATIVIRRATVDDGTAIARVQVESWRTTYRGIVDQQYIDRLSVDERAQSWTQRLAAEERPDVFVDLDENGAIVGFISGGRVRVDLAAFDAELYAIYLLERAQRHGRGRQLVTALANALVETGLSAMMVRVLAENPACRFYERLGGRLVQEGELQIGERSYPERWYGWDDLWMLTGR